MTDNIPEILDKLGLSTIGDGRYENHFYIIDIPDSDSYAKVYTILDNNAINTDAPNFAQNTNNSTVKITNYFETSFDNIDYNIFLIADFDNDKYYVKIKEVPQK